MNPESKFREAIYDSMGNIWREFDTLGKALGCANRMKNYPIAFRVMVARWFIQAGIKCLKPLVREEIEATQKGRNDPANFTEDGYVIFQHGSD